MICNMTENLIWTEKPEINVIIIARKYVTIQCFDLYDSEERFTFEIICCKLNHCKLQLIKQLNVSICTAVK